MNYSKHYNLLVDRAKNRINEVYTESHHIIPKCMGGSDDKCNLVELTPEEHYIAHQLLVKIYPTNKSLIKAANMMSVGRTTNKLYGWLRRKLSIAMSESQLGTKNTQYGTRWIRNDQLKISKKIKKEDITPLGWVDGRTINFNKKQKLKKQSKPEVYRQRKKRAEKIANELFEQFKESNYDSICAFAKANKTTQPRLCMLWKKYVTEFNQHRKQGKKFK